MDRTVGKRRCRRWRGADHYYLQDVAETWMEVRSGAGASLLSHPAYLAGDDMGNECRRRGMVRLVRAHERSAEPRLEGLSFPRAEGLTPKLSASSKRNSVQSRFSSLHYRSEDVTTSRAEVVIYLKLKERPRGGTQFLRAAWGNVCGTNSGGLRRGLEAFHPRGTPLPENSTFFCKELQDASPQNASSTSPTAAQ